MRKSVLWDFKERTLIDMADEKKALDMNYVCFSNKGFYLNKVII